AAWPSTAPRRRAARPSTRRFRPSSARVRTVLPAARSRRGGACLAVGGAVAATVPRRGVVHGAGGLRPECLALDAPAADPGRGVRGGHLGGAQHDEAAQALRGGGE